MASFAKPENALKRAEELMNVGQKQAALQALHDLITSKRHRNWQKTMEKIMLKYVELCVDMRKGRYAKDGLIQYRIICQQVNVSSLEEVIKHFMKLATEKAEQAQAAAEKAILEVADLEEDRSPEDLMLSFVSGEKGKERQDLELVTPWFKFLWETYRTVLDILRNNSKLETLYAMTAHRAFQFCLQYKRTNEFRRLCEILRTHLANLNKYRDQRDRPDLSLPESFQLYLDTRFEQLKAATELELWQEAFRSIEDIHGLVTLVKKSPKPSMMAVYYAKLTKIFQMANSHLFHAFAWLKLYLLQRSHNKNLKEKDVQLMASCVVLSALSVLPHERHQGQGMGLGFGSGGGSAGGVGGSGDGELERERAVHMAGLLGVSVQQKKDVKDVLSRSALFAELSAKGVVAYALPQVKELYHLLELDFHPLDLAPRVAPLFQRLSEMAEAKLSSAAPLPRVDLKSYVPQLEKAATLRILQQVSQVYDVIRVSNLAKLITFGDLVFIERLLVAAVKGDFLHAKLNHREGIVSFGQKDLESSAVRGHLSGLASGLAAAVAVITPPAPKEERPLLVLQELNATVEKEHQRLLARKLLIEKRKEMAEREMLEKEREDQKEKIMAQRQSEEAEAKRLAAESKRREEERIRREIEERELEEARALLAEAEKRKGKKGKKATEQEPKKLDKRQLMEEALSEQMKEKAEADRRLQKTAKTMDHLERAKREEEKPLLEAAYLQKLEDDRVFFEQQQAAALKASEEQHGVDLQEKRRLERMLGAKATFEEQVVGRRTEEFARLKREREERLAELKEMRRVERDILRRKEWYKRQEEEKAYEALRQEEIKKREEAERKKREEQERLRKLEEIAAKQRQREQEAEEKAKKEREELLRREEAPRPGRYVPRARLKAMEGGEAPSSDLPPSAGAAPAASRDSDFTPSAAAAGAASSGGKYAPPTARGGGSAFGAARRDEPSRERDAEGPPARARYEPSRSGGGGRYEPPSKKEGGTEERSAPRFIGRARQEAASKEGEGARPLERPREVEKPKEVEKSAEAPKAAGASDGKWRPRHLRS